MTNYEISKSEKACAACGQELADGTSFHSAIFETDETFERKDYCQTCWQDPPEGCFSHWVTCVEPVKPEEKRRLDANIVLGFFQDLEDKRSDSELNFRYVIGLLMMRKRILKFADIERKGRDEFLLLRQSRKRRIHRVLVRQLSEEEIASLMEEVGRFLAASTVLEEDTSFDEDGDAAANET